MNLIVETDIGHDPDDLFALCYLMAAGVNIKAILVHPGDPDQIAMARVLRKEFKQDFPIGFDKKDRNKNSSGRLHHWLCKEYGESINGKADGYSADIIKDVIEDDTELFIIGPATTIGNYLEETGKKINRATMQGGFLAYDLHNYPCFRVDKFEQKISVPTFNLNGDRKAGQKFLNANIEERRMVGKNVCHTMKFTGASFSGRNTKFAPEIFSRAFWYYFQVLNNTEKIFHDPTAAVLHLHPEIGNWVRGRTIKMSTSTKMNQFDDKLDIKLDENIPADGWGTIIDSSGDYILADINYELFWDQLFSFK